VTILPEISPQRIAGLTAVSAFLIFTFIAFLNYPGYDFTSQFLSELGTGPGAVWFNAGLMLSGICLAAFFMQLMKKYHAMSMAGILCGLALSGIGIFPLPQEPAHGIMAALFFVLAGTTLLIFAFRNARKKRIPAFFSLVAVAADVVYILLRDPVTQKIAIGLFVIALCAIVIQEE